MRLTWLFADYPRKVKLRTRISQRICEKYERIFWRSSGAYEVLIPKNRDMLHFNKGKFLDFPQIILGKPNFVFGISAISRKNMKVFLDIHQGPMRCWFNKKNKTNISCYCPFNKCQLNKENMPRDLLQIRIILKFEFLFRNAVRCNQGTSYKFTDKRSTDWISCDKNASLNFLFPPH
jgi:hypothetical protein